MTVVVVVVVVVGGGGGGGGGIAVSLAMRNQSNMHFVAILELSQPAATSPYIKQHPCQFWLDTDMRGPNPKPKCLTVSPQSVRAAP